MGCVRGNQTLCCRQSNRTALCFLQVTDRNTYPKLRLRWEQVQYRYWKQPLPFCNRLIPSIISTSGVIATLYPVVNVGFNEKLCADGLPFIKRHSIVVQLAQGLCCRLRHVSILHIPRGSWCHCILPINKLAVTREGVAPH